MINQCLGAWDPILDNRINNILFTTISRKTLGSILRHLGGEVSFPNGKGGWSLQLTTQQNLV